MLGVVAGAVSTGLQLVPRDTGPLPTLVARQATVTAVVTITDDPRRTRASLPGRPLYVASAQFEQMIFDRRALTVGGRVILLGSGSAAEKGSGELGRREAAPAETSRPSTRPGDPQRTGGVAPYGPAADGSRPTRAPSPNQSSAGGEDWDTVLPGQRMRVRGTLVPARDRDLTVATLRVKGPPERLGDPPWIQRAAGRLRDGLRRACADLPPAERGLLPGLVVGDVSQLDPKVEEDFRTTGMTHLIAVSGSNCAIVSGAVLLLCRRLRVPPRLSAVLAGIALVGFVVLARPSPSVLRAALMGGIALLALATGRTRAALPCLLAAVGALILVDPALARSAGFALSVLATAGLLIIAPRWGAKLRARGVPGGIAEALAVPAAAQVVCQPIIVALFGTIGLVAVPANLLVVPAVAPATIAGVVVAVLSPLSSPIAAWLAWWASWPVSWMVLVARTGASVPGGVLPWPSGLVGGLALAAVLATVLLAARWRPIRWLLAAALAAVLLVALPIRIVAPGWPPAGWLAVGCAVGQGDAVVINAGNGSAVVVDTGPEPSAVDSCLVRLGIRDVPLLVLSHLHADHVGGVTGVMTDRRVGSIVIGTHAGPISGRAVLDRAILDRHRTAPGEAGPRIQPVAVGARYQVGALSLAVLAPLVKFSGTRSDPNNNSLVLLVTVGGRSMLFAGDAEVEEQRSLLAAGGPPRVDILKVPHHGSMYSDSRFLDTARPSVALIEVGADNDYGHPSPGILTRLHRAGTRVLRTDLDGDVAVLVRDGHLLTTTRGISPTDRPP